MVKVQGTNYKVKVIAVAYAFWYDTAAVIHQVRESCIMLRLHQHWRQATNSGACTSIGSKQQSTEASLLAVRKQSTEASLLAERKQRRPVMTALTHLVQMLCNSFCVKLCNRLHIVVLIDFTEWFNSCSVVFICVLYKCCRGLSYRSHMNCCNTFYNGSKEGTLG